MIWINLVDQASRYLKFKGNIGRGRPRKISSKHVNENMRAVRLEPALHSIVRESIEAQK